MLDDAQYVIVPNETEYSSKADRQPFRQANDNGHYVAELVLKGYRIIRAASNRDSIHYVLIKFKNDRSDRTNAGSDEPILDAVGEDDNAPITLDDINF